MPRLGTSIFATLLALACGREAAPAGAPPSGASSPPAEPAPGDQPESITSEECQARSGEVLTDKGDGSLHSQGCPEGRTALGSVRVGIEGGLCCAVSAASAPSAPSGSGKRAPCELGADQTCNEDPAVSAIWGRCLPSGTCECKPGFELGPSGYCRPVK